jgi:hypothetical protein
MIYASLEQGVKPMANRKIQLDVKVQAMRECLRLANVEATMRKHQLSERSAFRWFEQILERLPDILQETKPGPKSQRASSAAPPRRRNRSAKR